MAKKLADDEELRRWGMRLQKKANKFLVEGRIHLVQYRDASWIALLATKPRGFVKVTGI